MSIEALYGLRIILPNHLYRVPTDQGTVSLHSAKGLPTLSMSNNWRQRRATNSKILVHDHGCDGKRERAWMAPWTSPKRWRKKRRTAKLSKAGLDQHEGYGRGWKRRGMRS